MMQLAFRRAVRSVASPALTSFRRFAARCSPRYREIRMLTHRPVQEMLTTGIEYVYWSKLEGDYLEFGVWEGNSFVLAYRLAQRRRLKSMRFYAFDSFEGLPEITGVDASGFRNFRQGEYACSLDQFSSNLKKAGVPLEKTTLVPGFYDRVLNDGTKKQLPLHKAALVWVDCDLYESTVPVLDFVTEYVQDGTLLIFDDWFFFRGNPSRGQQRAFAEWLQRNPAITATEYRRYGWGGMAFILHRS